MLVGSLLLFDCRVSHRVYYYSNILFEFFPLNQEAYLNPKGHLELFDSFMHLIGFVLIDEVSKFSEI